MAVLATIGVTMFLLLRKTERLINYKTTYLPSVFSYMFGWYFNVNIYRHNFHARIQKVLSEGAHF